MKYEPGTQVELVRYGKWVGPYTVTDRVGRTPDHLVLRNPQNGVLFEEYNDPYNVRVFESEWTVRIRADVLRPGTRFIFSEELGGEGEVLTVESIANMFGTTEVATEELDFTIDINSSTMVTVSND